MRPPRSEETASERPSRYYLTWLPSQRSLRLLLSADAPLATMDSTVAIVALLPRFSQLRLMPAAVGGSPPTYLRRADAARRPAWRTLLIGRNALLLALRYSPSRRCAVAPGRATLVIARPSCAGPPSHSDRWWLIQCLPGGTRFATPTAVLRRDDRDRVGDGAGGRGALTEVMAVGVPGERADRAGDDLPGLAPPYGKPTERMKLDVTGAIPAAGMHRGGFRLLDRSRLDVRYYHRFGPQVLAALSCLSSEVLPRTQTKSRSTCSGDRKRLVTFSAIPLAGGVIPA